MKKIPKLLLLPMGLALLAAILWLWFAWERPLMDVLPQEAWTFVQAWGDGKEVQGQTAVRERITLDDQLPAFLEALREAKVSRDDTPSHVLSMPCLEFWIHCDLHPWPTLLYIQSNGDIAFAVHMDTDHYQYYEGGQELYNTLTALGLPVKQ